MILLATAHVHCDEPNVFSVIRVDPLLFSQSLRAQPVMIVSRAGQIAGEVWDFSGLKVSTVLDTHGSVKSVYETVLRSLDEHEIFWLENRQYVQITRAAAADNLPFFITNRPRSNYITRQISVKLNISSVGDLPDARLAVARADSLDKALFPRSPEKWRLSDIRKLFNQTEIKAGMWLAIDLIGQGPAVFHVEQRNADRECAGTVYACYTDPPRLTPGQLLTRNIDVNFAEERFVDSAILGNIDEVLG